MAFKIPVDTNVPTSKEQLNSWAAAKEEIHNMKGGDGMDRLIAEKIFGAMRDEKVPLYPYSSNPECAFLAAGRADLFDDSSISLSKDVLGRWVVVARSQSEEALIACGDTPALAICKALLILDFDEKHPVVRPAVTYIQRIESTAFSGSKNAERHGRGAFLGGHGNKNKKGEKGKKGK